MTLPETTDRAAFDPDRERGILTTTDRQYLLNEADIEPGTQAERDTRQRIRNRAYSALLDFELLLQHLEPRDRRQIFEQRTEKGTEREWAVLESVDAAIAFLFLGMGDIGQEDREFAKHVENGIRRAYAERDVVLEEVDCEIHTREGEPHSNLDERALSDVPMAELQQLLTAKKITPQEFADAVKAKEGE
ncbi:hypothetical protein [Haloferax volcanii]|uniref:hypothetical protein n=1 Tax=Haloferax volcanii TaxID=2246 RepID=UPI003D30384B